MAAENPKDMAALQAAAAAIIAPGRVVEAQEDAQGALFLVIEAPGGGPMPELEQRLRDGLAPLLAGAPLKLAITAHRPAPAAGPAANRPLPPGQAKLEGVRHLIAVAAGKGGVGKSTVAVNLALALAATGWRVGLLDADIYGPSIPTLTGAQAPTGRGPSGKAKPAGAFGLKIMSIGFRAPADAPIVWRAPIVTGALVQMLTEVEWAPLDVLVIDMPPGTGDIQLTLAQRAALSGAVIVSTPQEVALADVRRAVAMFDKVATPILGVVENMAFFVDPVSGNVSHIFGEGGARRLAATIGAPFLGEIPIDPALRAGGDRGRPIMNDAPDAASGRAFRRMASMIRDALEAGYGLKPAPVIVFE